MRKITSVVIISMLNLLILNNPSTLFCMKRKRKNDQKNPRKKMKIINRCTIDQGKTETKKTKLPFFDIIRQNNNNSHQPITSRSQTSNPNIPFTTSPSTNYSERLSNILYLKYAVHKEPFLAIQEE